MADDEAAKIIAQLSAEAELVEAGEFTLDPAAARQKLRAHQLASEGAWALLLVEVGELLGVERIEVGEGPRSVHVRLLGKGVEQLAPLDQLDMLFAWAFASRDDAQSEHDADVHEARRSLALAINAVLDRGVELRVTTPARGVQLRFDAASGQRRELPGGRPSLVVEVDVPLRRDLLQPAAALVEVARRAGYGRAQVFVAGRRVVGEVPPAAGCLSARPLLLAGREIGYAGLRPPDHDRPRIIVAPHGVLLEASYAGFEPSAFFVVVTRGVDRDLSLAHIVQNDTYQRVCKVIKAAQREFEAIEATAISISESVPIDRVTPEVAALLLRLLSVALALCAVVGVVVTLLHSALLSSGTLFVIVLAALLSPLSWLASIHARRLEVLFPKPSLSARDEQLFFGDPNPERRRESTFHMRIR